VAIGASRRCVGAFVGASGCQMVQIGGSGPSECCAASLPAKAPVVVEVGASKMSVKVSVGASGRQSGRWSVGVPVGSTWRLVGVDVSPRRPVGVEVPVLWWGSVCACNWSAGFMRLCVDLLFGVSPVFHSHLVGCCR
jgi:hypothetical protein